MGGSLNHKEAIVAEFPAASSRQHSYPSVPFNFNGLALAAIQHEEDLWLTGEDIGRALEYSDPAQAVRNLFNRNKDELEGYSCQLKLSCEDGVDNSDGGAAVTRLRPVRVFNEEGVMILTMLSSQPKAAAFRAWAVAVLKAYRHGNLALFPPAARERLLETCIKEARFGNGAALHTLIAHFGYPESIRAPAAPAAVGEAAPVAAGMPSAVRRKLPDWFVRVWLPRLAAEIRAGGGPLLADLRAGRKHFRFWKEVAVEGALFALDHPTSYLYEIVAEHAAKEGVPVDVAANYFGRWLTFLEPEMNALGWTRTFGRNCVGGSLQVYRLALMEERP